MPISKMIQAVSPRGKNIRKESSGLLDSFLQQ